LHDSRTFKGLYDKIKNIGIDILVADAGYKTPAIAKLLIDDGIKPLLPYKRPMTKEGFFKKYEYVYDEYYDCYICPNNQVIHYSTTNKEGYREYKSCGYICETCPYIKQCTNSKDHVKVITKHIWEPYMETCEEIRHTLGMKELYSKRKETIERLFGTAKENHGFRYTQMYGKARMEMKVGLTFACINLKKLAKMKQQNGLLDPFFSWFLNKLSEFNDLQRKTELGFTSQLRFVYSLKGYHIGIPLIIVSILHSSSLCLHFKCYL
ncbi:MAG: transposase, partial [Lachnospiraceae bacterium]